MSCRNVVPLLEPFSDGELGPERVVEVEQHLGECPLCMERVRLGKALRGSVRQLVRSKAEPSEAFRQRLAGALEAAHQREWEARVLERQVRGNHMLSWRTILPTAAAAAMILVWAGSTTQPNTPSAKREVDAAAVPTSVDEMIATLVDHHVQNRPEVTEPRLVPQFEREVGVPLNIPNLTQYGARWESGSVVPVKHDRRDAALRAASLRYKLAGHRVTLYVYKSSRFPIERALKPRLVGDAAVYVGSHRGYSIGATERAGVGYAVASDLNDAETAEIVAAIY